MQLELLATPGTQEQPVLKGTLGLKARQETPEQLVFLEKQDGLVLLEFLDTLEPLEQQA